MSDIDANVDRALDLTEAVCDEVASPRDLEELDVLLLADGRSRQDYLDYYRMHVALRLQLRARRAAENVQQRINSKSVPSVSGNSGEGPVETPSTAPLFLDNTIHGTVGYFSSGWPVAYLVATVICGVGLLIGSLVYVSDPVQFSKQSTPLPSPLSSLSSVVGRITGMVDCQWAEVGWVKRSAAPPEGGRQGESGSGTGNPQSLIPNPQSLVSLGDKFALASGLMEITYDTGAKVILQGPVTYEVESAAGGFLSVGKLTAKVEKGSGFSVQESEASNHQSEIINQKSSLSTIHYPLFTIKTPTATVTDLGTEFGVEVSKEGHTTSHVFRGVVEVQPIARDGQPGKAVRLTENESARVEKGENSEGLTVRRTNADPAAFVRAGQLPKSAEERKLESFRRWQAYSQQLRGDPSLLAYYDFQQRRGEPATLPNVAANGDHSLDGAIENARWTAGRMSGKHALLFNGPADCVRVNLPQKTDNLTLSAWVCVNILMPEQLSSGLLMSDGWLRNGQVHWQLGNPDGHIGFSTVGCVVGSGNAVSPTVVGHQELRCWMHLVCVYDHAAQQVRFYAQGRHVADVEYGMNVPICIGAARVANWDTESRTFRGRIDELAIFGRPLPADEIQRMYEAESPLSEEP